MRSRKIPYRKIAEVIGCTHKTVRDEWLRNRSKSPIVQSGQSALEMATFAHAKAKERKRNAGRKKQRLKTLVIREYVIRCLCELQMPPAEISASIKDELAESSISESAIRNFIKYERPELKEHLFLRGKARRARVNHRRSAFRQGVPDKRSIDYRPQPANDRSEVGHWEGDLIVSCRDGSGAILTLIDRMTRHREHLFVQDLKAETVLKALVEFFRKLPPHARKTLTLDNGAEFAVATMTRLEMIFPGFEIYYCHPYQAYERGSVEWANGKFRWYFPKGTDFSKISLDDLAAKTNILQHRRLRCLGWRKACDVFADELKRAA